MAPSDVMFIDKFLPEAQFRSRHTVEVSARPPAVYRAVSGLDLSASRGAKALFRLRGLPPTALTLPGLERLGFVRLGERPDSELLLGLIGRFWRPSGALQRVTPEAFLEFNRTGFAKAVWGFALHPRQDGLTTLVTETRVHCLDHRSERRFGLYWRVIGPFSGWIRRVALDIIRRQAESAETGV